MPNELHIAAADPEKKGYLRVKYLIEEEKVNVNELHTQHKTRAIDFATQSGSLETLKYLIEEANADLQTPKGNFNLLFWVGENNNPDIINYVTDPKRELYKKFNDGTTDLHVAIAASRLTEVIKLIEEKPDRFCEADQNGRTALDWACLVRKESIVDFFATHEALKPFFAANKEDTWRRLAKFKMQCGKDFYDENEDQPTKAIKTFQEAMHYYNFLANKTDKDYAELAKCYGWLALLRSEGEDYIGALEEINKGKTYFQKVAVDDEKNKFNLLNAIHWLEGTQKAYQLEREAQLFGFQCNDVISDGDCFFHAVTDQFHRWNKALSFNLTSKSIREKTVMHILTWQDFYKDFIEGDFYAYIQTMSKEGSWADSVAIQAFTRTFNVTLAIINSDGSDPVIMKREKPDATLYLGYETDFHYQSLYRRADWLPAKLIEDNIKKAPIDDFQTSTILKNKKRRQMWENMPVKLSKVATQTFYARNPSESNDKDQNDKNQQMRTRRRSI